MKATLPQSLIQWRRFWCVLGAQINASDGFLTNPEGEFGRHFNPGLSTLDKLFLETVPLVLCGEPGIGKSTELENLRTTIQAKPTEFTDHLIWLVFRDVSDIDKEVPFLPNDRGYQCIRFWNQRNGLNFNPFSDSAGALENRTT